MRLLTVLLLVCAAFTTAKILVKRGGYGPPMGMGMNMGMPMGGSSYGAPVGGYGGHGGGYGAQSYGMGGGQYMGGGGFGGK